MISAGAFLTGEILKNAEFVINDKEGTMKMDVTFNT